MSASAQAATFLAAFHVIAHQHPEVGPALPRNRRCASPFGGRIGGECMHGDLLPVPKLYGIEMRGCASKMRGIEFAGTSVRIEQLGARGCVAETQKVIRERLRQYTCRTHVCKARAAAALGQGLPPCIQHQRQMAVPRRRQIQRFQNQQLARRVGEMILAAQHVADFHQRIIKRIGEKEGRRTVGATDDEVADIAAFHPLLAANEIVEYQAAAFRHPEA